MTLVILSLRARRLMADATESSIQGVSIKLTRDSGPALAGLLDYVILLPEWCLHLPELDQTLIIEHERAHANARDPLMVWLAGLAIAAFPWNAGLWYVIRRLRTSIELDCDARVLERMSDTYAYGSLLLKIGARSSKPALMAPAFSEHASELQRRIRVMSRRNRIADRGVVLFASISTVLLLTAAVRAPRPGALLQTMFQAGSFGAFGKSGEIEKAPAGKRNFASVSVFPKVAGITTVMIFPTGYATVGLGLHSAPVRRDTIYVRAPASFTAD
ncbi:MAG: M56 family metallopeptidase, partial [Thermoanaerobaculia bacterium]